MPPASPLSDPPTSPAPILADVAIQLNGRERHLRVDTRRTLLEALRADCGLTGAKQGCGVGNCGACTILLDGRPVYACLVLAVECEGRAVETIESDDDELLPRLRQAFLEHDAFQCGYCTPGQILSLKALFSEDPRPDEQSIRRALAGNLCRCGAYSHIVEAALAVAGGGPGEGEG